MSGDHNINQTDSGWRKRQIALDIKAKNARELGLDYESSMTKDEALKLALEALERTQNEGYNLPGIAIRKAITAIKEALAQPEQKYIYGTPLLDAMTQDYVPPQRTWVGLTDKEIYEIGFDINVGGLQTMKAYKAVEAKLRSKNDDS